MQRDIWTKKLVRIIADIEAGRTPSPVRELYVFGSYARGALECKDLDLVVVHEHPSAELINELTQKAKENPRNIVELYGAWDLRFCAMMGRAIRRPGEEIDLLIGADLEKALCARKIKQEDLYLIWSAIDRDWQAKLQAIRLDPTAGSAPRDTFISPKLAETREEDIIHIGTLLRDQILVLTRFDAGKFKLEELTPEWIEIFNRRRWGKRIKALIPYAFAWLGLEQVESLWPTTETGEIWEMPKRRIRIKLGRFQLYWMLDLFKSETNLKKQCLVPPFRRAYPKEIFVFERGAAWASFLESEERKRVPATDDNAPQTL